MIALLGHIYPRSEPNFLQLPFHLLPFLKNFMYSLEDLHVLQEYININSQLRINANSSQMSLIDSEFHRLIMGINKLESVKVHVCWQQNNTCVTHATAALSKN
jgi:hypothetical protein